MYCKYTDVSSNTVIQYILYYIVLHTNTFLEKKKTLKYKFAQF